MIDLVLVGMSITDVDRRADLVAAARSRGGSVAFLQMGDPSLSLELTRLADAGAEAITLVGVDLGPLAPAHSWLRRIAGHWWRERAGSRPILDVATRLVSSLEDLDDALATCRPVLGTEPGLTSAAWEDVTGHRHQVLICRGPRCTARGSEESMRALIIGLVEAGLGDKDVLVTHTGCQFPCNQAPVVSVQPDDVWYGDVDPEVSREIVTRHLVGGTPVEGHRLPR
ncbi:(2Fe-2S) ferredoxin domain-containing protein [Nocardioides sp.]|uniref:(2Fe-2S) ferredoxin domain-containing protein n=1 Tax=Nocardioides sp. TaxID=35761 RepID=UPI002B5526CC|nr:(2Fe-2S) ferredoxin domain-containing protein [Nocardioides sp.]HXH79446.1 (2Fe-2S) ferredoxin domain-containing protein [Nocardioides sp.]